MRPQTKAIDEEVIGILRRSTYNDQFLVLPYQLPRDLYVKTNKVIEALGGKWNRSAKKHLFEEGAGNRIADAMETGTFDRPADYGFFETPEDWAGILAESAWIKETDRCMEPSAGKGRLLRAIEKYVPRSQCYAVEMQPELSGELVKSGWHNTLCANFMECSPEQMGGKFDKIIMNPPFSKQQDVKHVLHAYDQFLAKDGKLVAIMSAGVEFRQTLITLRLRDLIFADGSIVPMPDGAFKESGTIVRTVIVTLRK